MIISIAAHCLSVSISILIFPFLIFVLTKSLIRFFPKFADSSELNILPNAVFKFCSDGYLQMGDLRHGAMLKIGQIDTTRRKLLIDKKGCYIVFGKEFQSLARDRKLRVVKEDKIYIFDAHSYLLILFKKIQS